ncbi:hypothetical protein MTR67_051121 [Solanum verrucosum]|uniref:Uncharacterized protein n=1 Tax=Solanum verrucosum TaxID=315347 RepID=A0AAF0ZZU9_SOLVR|nr:hypothetical protein MTR67_051121 [Solanum verrucosum]
MNTRLVSKCCTTVKVVRVRKLVNWQSTAPIRGDEDGRVICSSLPIYGKGKKPGNEAGYIVGMSSCYPRPGSIKLSEGETTTLLSNYSNDQRHIGVLGLFYLLVAERSLKHNSTLHSADGTGEIVILQNVVGALAVFGIALLVCAVVIYQRRNTRDQEGYESILTQGSLQLVTLVPSTLE